MVSQTSSADPYGTARHAREDRHAREALVDSRRAPKLELIQVEFALPDIPELRHVPRRIDAEDEGELRWFLRGPMVASIANSSGAFGNQLEIASAFGFGSLPCRRCGGRFRSRKRAGKDSVVDWRDGTGMAPRDHFGRRVSYATALAEYRKRMQKENRIVLMSKPQPRPGIDPESAWSAIEDAFRQQGKRLMADAVFRQIYDRLPESLCQPCRPCQGIGVVPRRAAAHVEVTAYPTGSSKHGSGVREELSAITSKISKGVLHDGTATVDLRELARYRDVSRILADVAGMSALAVESLEDYYRAESGQRALEELIGERFGLKSAARMRAASKLRDFQCQLFNLASYGAQ